MFQLWEMTRDAFESRENKSHHQQNRCFKTHYTIARPRYMRPLTPMPIAVQHQETRRGHVKEIPLLAILNTRHEPQIDSSVNIIGDILENPSLLSEKARILKKKVEEVAKSAIETAFSSGDMKACYRLCRYARSQEGKPFFNPSLFQLPKLTHPNLREIAEKMETGSRIPSTLWANPLSREATLSSQTSSESSPAARRAP